MIDILRRTPRPLFIGALLAAVAFGGSDAQADETQAAESTEVRETFDHSTFHCTQTLDREYDTFRVYRLTYPSPVVSKLPQNNTITAELYLPKAAGKSAKPLTPRPAVVCLHILGGGFELAQLQCTALARRGIAAVWFKLPYYGERGPPEGTKILADHPRLFTEAVHQGQLDVRRTVDVLSARPEIDRRHIGVMGVSLGGILAATSAEEEPRISRAALILAGGDLLPIVRHTRETRHLSEMLDRLPEAERTEVEKAIGDSDPLKRAAALSERAKAGRVLMINAAEDEVIPHASTEKLATALGIADRVVWLPGLGHYSALAALPQALKTATDFFAADLAGDAVIAPIPPAATKPRQAIARLCQQAGEFIGDGPKAGHSHLADLEVHVALKEGKKYEGRLRIARGPKDTFSVSLHAAGVIDDVALGNADVPWLAAKGHLFLGARDAKDPVTNDSRKMAFQAVSNQSDGLGSPSYKTAASDPAKTELGKLSPEVAKGVNIIKALLGALSMAPEMLDQWVTIDELPNTSGGERPIRVRRRDGKQGELRFYFRDASPSRLEAHIDGVSVTVAFHAWQIDSPAEAGALAPPPGLKVQDVPAADLVAMYGAALNLAAEHIRPPAMPSYSQAAKIVARDPAGHGLLCELHGKRVLLVEGTPEQMGTAHGRLLRPSIASIAERTVYAVGAGDTLMSGNWWFDRMAEIERRAGPHVPPRFVAECDAMARAAGVSTRDARAANLFPERFHCSGVAVRGKATADGRVLHARVLDYMSDIGLQNHACVAVFMPEGRNAWISAGYAGFLGTVTAMNERGLAIGEMGGRGEGEWDGVPMSFLLRDVMERAATVDEALAILRESPRTCEYYYVISDKHRNMAGVHCTPREVEVVRPGEQDPRLPHVPEDTVMISGGHRAELLSERLQQSFGRIDVPKLIEIVKRPVAMTSNLHEAIFSPETQEVWIADAGAATPACDEPYAKFNLADLLAYFRANRN